MLKLRFNYENNTKEISSKPFFSGGGGVKLLYFTDRLANNSELFSISSMNFSGFELRITKFSGLRTLTLTHIPAA